MGLQDRWESQAGKALLERLRLPEPIGREELVEMCSPLERVDETSSGIDFRSLSREHALVFMNVDLRDAVFDGAQPSVLNFVGRVDLRGASFVGAKLDRAVFGSVGNKISLREADFSKASLRYASFERAMAREVVFRNADLFRAQFARADLRGADFKGADCRDVPFGEVRFDEATRFEGTRLTEGYLDDALAAHARQSLASIEEAVY